MVLVVRRKREQSPAEGESIFETDPGPLDECVTPWGGLPLFVRAVRSLDVPGSVKRNLRLKQRWRGPDEPSYGESFLVLNAVGGECLEDFACLGEDPAVAEILGYEPPGPEGARKFLYQFHDKKKIEETQQQLGLNEVSCISGENAARGSLAQVNQDLVQELGRRCADQKIATIDLDGTIIESWKKQAKKTYAGPNGYQPLLALWAEMIVVVAGEFRDGNLPA